MDGITQDNISPQTGRELISPLPPKRPRIDCPVVNGHSGKNWFDFPELLAFRKTDNIPSLKSMLKKSEGLICSSQLGDFQEEKTYEQSQGTQLNVTPVTKMATSHSDSAHTGSSQVCLITAETHLLLLGKDEQLSVPETDKLSQYPGDDAGGSLAESPASASTDTPSHPDCKRLGKSLEDETPGVHSLYPGNDEDGRQVQNYVSQIQAVTFSSRKYEVTCQSDCSHKDDDTGFCNTQSQFSEGVESHQRRDELEFSENNLFSKEEGPMSDGSDSKPLYSVPEEDPSGNLAGGGKSEKNKSELQIWENEIVCDEETKGQVNEDGMSTTVIPSAAECAEGSVLSSDVVTDRNTSIETAGLEVDDFCVAEGEHAAGKIIAEAWSEMADHTTEIPMPARISQEAAEGDNDAGPFGVIDPAIWSETDREAEEKLCNSESTADVELSLSVDTDEMETLLPLCPDVRPSQKVSSPDQTEQFNHQRTALLCDGENEDFCQSYTETQACSIITKETHDRTGNEDHCQWKSSPRSSPAKPLAAGNDAVQENHDVVGHQLKEQSQSSCSPVSFDHLKTREVEYSQSENDRTDETAEIKEREEIGFVEEMESDEQDDLEKKNKSEEKLQLQNEQHKDDTTEICKGDCVSEQTEGETCEHDAKLKLIGGELGDTLECLSDQQVSAVVSMMDVITEEKEKNVTNIGEEMKTDGCENSEIPTDVTEVSPGKWREGDKLTPGSEDDQEHKLSCVSDCQHRAENKDDLLPLTFVSTSHAVVPCQRDSSHSQKALNSPTALNCSDRFSLLPSAFSLYNRMLRGVDTFEKIQLSPDDDVAVGLCNIPVLTSSPIQLLKTPQRQLPMMPVAESDKHEEIPEEEDEEESEEVVERLECHTENAANGFVSSDSACNELPNFISGADAIALRLPEQKNDCEAASESSEYIQDEFNPQSKFSTFSTERDCPASDVNDCSEFEMKKQFDMVLKELNLFFDISRNDFASDCGPSSAEQCSDVTEPLEGDASKHLSSPELGGHRDTSSVLDDADEGRSLEMCGGDPVVSRTAISSDGEQEVPLSRHLCKETSADTAEKHREPGEMEQKRRTWSPSFMCLPLLEQLSHRPPEHPRRLEPLKTCTRPIRVGLSKRAKTKHLHRPHPDERTSDNRGSARECK